MNLNDCIDNQLKLSNELNNVLKDVSSISQNDLKSLSVKVENLSNLNKSNLEQTREIIKGIKSQIFKISNINTNDEITNELNTIMAKLSIIEENLKFIKNNVPTAINQSQNIIQKPLPVTNPISNNQTPIEEIIRLKKNSNAGKYKSQTTEQKVKNNNTFELNVGKNALNVIGIILILISLITFGRHVYINFMSDMVKGLSLFIVSGLTLTAGQLIKGKNKWFSSGISALGVSALYVSLMTNYIFLDNLNIITAIVLIISISGLSIFISFKDNSNLIRIITLIGANICLIPYDNFSNSEGIIAIVLLLSVATVNMLLKVDGLEIKKLKFSFENYSSVILMLFFLIDMLMFDRVLALLLAIGYLLILHIMYLKSSLKGDILLSSSVWLSVLTGIIGLSFILLYSHNQIPTILLIFLALIGFGLFYIFDKKNLKYAYYTQALISLLLLTVYNSDVVEPFILLVILAILTYIVFSINGDSKYNINHNIILFFSLIAFGSFTDFFIVKMVFYVGLIIVLLILKSIDNVDLKSTVFFKYFSIYGLIHIVLAIVDNYSINIDVPGLTAILLIMGLAYLFLINFVPTLISKNIKRENILSSALILIISMLPIGDGFLYFILSLTVSIVLLSVFFTEKYIDMPYVSVNVSPIKHIIENKLLAYSIFGTYTIIRFTMLEFIGSDYSNIVMSIMLITFAFASICIGFIQKSLYVRRYGLTLALLVCLKLIFIDLYELSFIAKTGLFLVVGVIALAISYTYNKLEKKL